MINKLLYFYQFIRNLYDNLFSNELNEEQVLKKYLKKKIIFFDIGFNLGFETNKIINMFKNHNLKIHAFEPNPQVTPRFDKKFIKFNKIAITNNINKKTQQFVQKKISSSSGLKKYVKLGKTDILINVPTIRLIAYCKKNKLKKIDFIKIDIEGAELECLKSLEDLITNVKLFKIELTSKNFVKVLNYLNNKSFIFIGVINSKYIDLKLNCSNAYFINSKYDF